MFKSIYVLIGKNMKFQALSCCCFGVCFLRLGAKSGPTSPVCLVSCVASAGVLSTCVVMSARVALILALHGFGYWRSLIPVTLASLCRFVRLCVVHCCGRLPTVVATSAALFLVRACWLLHGLLLSEPLRSCGAGLFGGAMYRLPCFTLVSPALIRRF